MTIIIVNGVTASGKTTLARMLSEKLLIPFFDRDDFKEIAFDFLGHQEHDLNWSSVLGQMSHAQLQLVMKRMVETGHSVIISTNFNYEIAKKELTEVLSAYKNLEILEIHCVVDPMVRMERFNHRITSGKRHPGHSNVLLTEISELSMSSNGSRALSLGRVMELDTTLGISDELLNSVMNFIESYN